VGFSWQQKLKELLLKASSHLAFPSVLLAHKALVKEALLIANHVPQTVSSMVSDARLALKKPTH